MRRIPLALIAPVCLLACLLAESVCAAQAPVALPYTMTTIGGTSPMAATQGTQCPNLPTGVVSTDAFGDGCLAVNGIFGVGAFSGLVVDPFGNVLVNDDIKGALHLINPNSGIMTLVAGGGTACSSKQDSSGDGCVAATGTPVTPIEDARGIGIDPYGNILLAGFNDHFVHLICRNASPLCGSGAPSAASPIQIPIGNMGLVAGCAGSSGSSGASGVGVDNTPGYTTPTPGLFSGSQFVNAGGGSSACSASLGEVDQPRGVSADAYGNVYYADTTSERWRVVLGPESYNGVTNPLWAVLEQNSTWYNGTTKFLTAGYAYTVAGASTTATTKGSSCAGGGIALDANGDGCLFTAATVFASTSDAQGVGVDAAGNMVFTDAGRGLLRVLFVSGAGAAGAAMVNAIEVNNVGMNPSSPQPGFVYSVAGGGTTGGVSATPALGNSRSALDSSTTKLMVSPQGNIFIGDKTRVLFFDINTGFIRILVTQASSNVAAGSSCTTGQKSLSAYSDACPTSNAEFGNSNGLSVGVDGGGSLYIYDGTSSVTGQLVRKVLAQGLAEQSLTTPLIQNFEIHLPEAAAGTVSGATAALTSTPDMTAGTPACSENGDNSVDCLVSVTATPSAVGLRSAALTVTLPAGSWENASGSIALGGTIPGSVLAADNASTTTNGVTTPVAPNANAALSGIVPEGVALDGAGNVYAMDANSGSILESVQGAAGVAVSSHLPTNPSQIAVDQLGDVFAVGSGTASIEELKVSGAPASSGAPATFTPAVVSYVTMNNGTPAPEGITVDKAGDLYVADNQGSSANNAIYRLTLAPNAALPQVTVATGFVNPVSLAVDGSGDVFVADKGAGAVYKLAPNTNGTYAQTTILSGVVPVAVATDPAGDVYVQDESSASAIEVPLSGAETPVLTGLQNPTGVAVDGLGNLYSADATRGNILRVVRDVGAYGSTSTPLTSIAATLTNIGNQPATGTAQTDLSAFTLSASDCSVSSTTVFASGLACPVSATFSSSVLQNPGTAYTDALSFLAVPSIGSVSFSDIVPAGPTSMTLTGPTNPLFASSGTEATFVATVTGIASPSGSPISVTVSSITLSGTTVVYASSPTLNASGQAAIALSGLAPGNYSIAASYAGVANTYSPSSAAVSFTIKQFVATGDSRTVTEPTIPAVCGVLNADLMMVNNDIPASVDSTVSNPDGARIQAALNSCAGSGQAVELSQGSGGNNAFLSGPLSMPSGVTLLVDPGIVLFFSRNVQDYDTTPGTHTCGTVNNNSATASCLPLIDIPGSATNVGIMGFGKLDGRGGDPLLNAFPSSFAGQSWWGLSSIANNGGSQQNPRFVQMDSGSSNITLYKITLRNSPLFHISTTGAVSNFTAWDIKIVTPTSSRNTDGIDPGNAQNFTITRSWISDGDDNVAVGAANSVPAENISVTNNRFFAGHGESIGSFTQAGVSNVLFDSNMLSGNGIAGASSSIADTADSNSTGLRIKSGYDRGGVVTNIQYSNSCFQDHKAEIVFNPNYENTTGSVVPNFQNILMQNLAFLTAGTVQFTGTSDNGTIFPLQATLDNVSFPSTFAASEFSPAPTETAMTYGPGQVSSDFVSDYATFVNANGNTVTNNITATNLNAPVCSFTYIAPELTGPNGVAQTITEGQNATAVAILTPAVGGAAYPTGTVTLTDALTSDTTTVTLSGSSDTFFIPLTGLEPGTHSFTTTYSGDSNYTLTAGQTAYSTAGPYVVTVNAGSLGATTTTLSGVPSSVAFGTSFTATATVTGSSPTGMVEFIVNGTVYQSAPVSSGSASATISLPYSTSAYSIYAVYSGDGANDGSTSAAQSITVTPALTTTALSANSTTTTLGHPVVLTATVTSSVGAPAGTVTFTYTTTGSGIPQATTATLAASSNPNASVATAGIDLPVGTDSVTATYAASGSFAGSASTPMAFTVTPGTILPLLSNPIPLPYTMTSIAGGATANCSSETDSFGDGCPATSIIFGGSIDLRSVVADPFGNVYLTDGVASVIRRIAPNGVITDFAGRISGTTCAPSATVGCPPTEVAIDKARGIASDAQGNIYIAGYDSHEIFKVSVSTGLLYLIAGTGTAGSSGDGGPATSAQVNGPRGVWADSVGNVYIADTSNNKIRVVDVAGNIHTFAGTGTASSTGDGGLATAATINNPQGVMTDSNLNVYIADSSGDKIRVVCVTCGTGSPLDSLLATLGITSPQNGFIYTIAGGGSSSGPYPTLATNVSMSPQKLAIDLSGNIYISDGNGVAWFLDAHSANIRPIAGKTSGNCGTETDNFGDGCPATQAVIGDSGNGIGVGTDALGNLYISDTMNARIRKVITGLASPATATASTTSQSVELHFITGDTLAATNGLAFNSTEWSLSTPACTTNSDSTADCLLASGFTPAIPGARSTPLTVTSAESNTASLGLTGVGLGAGATLDPATQTSFGSGLAVAGLSADSAGNIYVSDSNSKQVLLFTPAVQAQGASATGTALGTFAVPGAVAVDPRGFVYVADTSAGTVTQISPSGAAILLPFTFTKPAGLAVDALNNLYVSDSAAQVVYQIDPITGVERTLALGTLVAPAGLAIDPAGNLLVSDPGAPAIYRFNFVTGTRTTVANPAVAPSDALTDAAGNLLIANTAAILAVPASTNSSPFTVASITPSALAVDSAGNLYTGAAGGVLKLTRTQGYVQFAASSSPATVNLLESGNQIYSAGSFTQTDTTDYSLVPTASTDCGLSSSGPGTVAVGGACALTATYTPTTFATTTDSVTFTGNLFNAALSNPAAVQLTLTGPATAPASTTTLGAFSPALPIYGQPVTLSATVTGGTLTPTGSVVFTVDSATYNATLVNGTASTVVNGLTAGSHSVSAAYTSSNGYASSTSTTATLVVGQATPIVTWPAPAAITYGTALTATQLDASASVGGTLTYTLPAGTVLNAGTQTLSVLFTPADATDYRSVNQTVMLMVNKAASSVTLTANPNPAAQGKPDVLTATVTGAVQPTGTVVFLSGSTTLCTTALNGSGVATCTFTPSALGTLSISAQYQGDTNHLSSSASLSLSVYDTSISLQFASTQLTYPGATNVTVCVSGATKATPTGTVQIVDGTTVLTTLTLGGNGCAYWYISPGLNAGSHSITTVYSGDKNNPPGTSDPTVVTVSPVPVNMSVSCWNSSFPYGVNYQCTVNVSSNAGSAQGNITYSYDGGAPVAVALSGGNAGFTITKPMVGNQSAVIGYAQQTNYAAATSQTENFTVTSAPVNVALTPSTWYATQGTSITFQAAITSWSAGAPDDNGSVSFYKGSMLLATVPVNASGQASYTTSSLPNGTDTITATYAGGTNYASGSNSVTITIVP
jgi:Glycosyl hydrolases family 28/Bacterial Ig-like domain (group 3)